MYVSESNFAIKSIVWVKHVKKVLLSRTAPFLYNQSMQTHNAIPVCNRTKFYPTPYEKHRISLT